MRKKENLPKCLGYFEIKHISNLCVLAIACNLKEHYEVFEDRDINKKHKGIKKGLPGMNFENFTKRINSLTNFDTFKKPRADYKEVSRLTVLDGEMQKKTVTKAKFLQFNDKQFYADGITSLPLCHQDLKELSELKKKKKWDRE